MELGSFADNIGREVARVASADPTLNVTSGRIEDHFELGQEIGSGSYGQAFAAKRKSDGQEVVLKRIRLYEMDEKARQDTVTEAKVLAQFNHVNIVHYYGLVLEGPVLNIVMEYASGGDLAAAITKRQQEKKPFSEDEIMFWFVQIVLALFHVHGKNVLHRDVKSQNIFIAEGNLLKLGDFGIARVLNSDTELARTVIGSPYYLSPEICEDRPYNRKSDVWSLGCVLYEMATLRRAFDGNSLPALVVKILRGKYPPVPSRYSSNLKSLIESMLKQNPKDRPGTDAILRLDYVRHHVERYAAHVMALGAAGEGLGAPVGPPDAAPAGQARGRGKGQAAAVAALGMAGRCMQDAKPKPSLPSRPTRASTPSGGSRPPKGPAASAAADAEAEAAPATPPPASAAAPRAMPGASAVAGPSASASPAAAAAPAGRRGAGGAGGKLVESGWIRQQQAALAELQGALNAQKAAAGSNQSPGPAPGAASAGGAAANANDATIVSPSPGIGSGTTAKAKLFELKVQREAELEAQRKAVAVAREQKKAALAKRTHDAATAVRSRAVERNRGTERHLAEQRAEVEAKARKALELAAAIKSKEDARKRELEEVAQHMSAHREQVRAAKARVSKEQLAELGAKFAANMMTAAQPDVAAGQVLVVDLASQPQPSSSAPSGSKAAAPAKASPSRTPARPPAGPGAGRSGSPGGAAAAKAAPKAVGQSPLAAKKKSGSGAEGDAAGPSGRGRAASAGGASAEPPPWKQHRARPGSGGSTGGGAKEFPAVQIFTPFGSSLDDPRPGENSDSAEEQDEEQQAAVGVLEVLAQIHTVLGVEGEEDDDAHAPSAGPPGARRQSSGTDGGGGGDRGARLRPSSAQDDDGGDGTPRHPAGGAAAAAANAHKVEQLRMDLEKQLGSDAFVAAYRCLRELQERADEAEGEGEGGGVPAAGVVAAQRELERVLKGRLHLARLLHKLVMLEDSVFA